PSDKASHGVVYLLGALRNTRSLSRRREGCPRPFSPPGCCPRPQAPEGSPRRIHSPSAPDSQLLKGPFFRAEPLHQGLHERLDSFVGIGEGLGGLHQFRSRLAASFMQRPLKRALAPVAFLVSAICLGGVFLLTSSLPVAPLGRKANCIGLPPRTALRGFVRSL